MHETSVTRIVYEFISALDGPIGAPVERHATEKVLPMALKKEAAKPLAQSARLNSASSAVMK